MSMEWRLMLEVLQEVGDAELLKRSDDRCYGAKQGRNLVPNDAQY